MTNEQPLARSRATRLDRPHPTGGYDEELTFSDGTTAYLRNGALHREDGPAWAAASGATTWLRNERVHREDGPAVILADGTKQYWLHGMRVSETVWRESPAGPA